MTKYMCTVCGYSHEGETPPEFCPQCRAAESKFKLVDQQIRSIADEHRIGVVDGIDPEILEDLRDEFSSGCLEVGAYIAMARQADREGFPEIANAYRRVAKEQTESVGRMAELLGEMLFADTKRNLEMRMDATFNACESKKKIATRAKQLNFDAIHDSMHEISKDESRYYHMFKGLRERYFE